MSGTLKYGTAVSVLAIALATASTAQVRTAEADASRAQVVEKVRPGDVQIATQEAIEASDVDVRRFVRNGKYTVRGERGKILAIEFSASKLQYWLIDPTTGRADRTELEARPGISLMGSPGTPAEVTFRLDQVEAVYMTRSKPVITPKYRVKFEGDVADDGISTWVLKGASNERAIFNRLRASDDGSQAVKTHRNVMIPGAAQLRTYAESDIETFKKTTAKTMIDDLKVAHQRHLNSIDFYYDTSGVDQTDLVGMNAYLQRVADGTEPMRPWVTELQDIATTFESQANADAGAVQAAASDAAATDKDPTLGAQGCLSIMRFVNANAKELSALEENADTENDGKDTFDAATRDPAMASAMREQKMTDATEKEADQLVDGVEQCALDAIGAEPSEPAFNDNSADYEAMIVRADAIALDREQKVMNIHDYLDTFAEFWEDQLAQSEGRGPRGVPLKYSPAVFAPNTEAATKLVNKLVGVGEVRHIAADASQASAGLGAVMLTVSSPTACMPGTWAWDFNLGSLGVVIGTPFNDRIVGNDTAGSYEVIFGLWGDDCINGRDGHELLAGNWGNDEIHGGDGHEIKLGGFGDDTLYAGHGEDYTVPITTGVSLRFYLGSLVSGSRGNDRLFGNDPANTPTPTRPWLEGYTNVFFGDGLDGLNPANAGNDRVDGQGGISMFFGQGGNDTLESTRGGRIGVVDSSGTAGAPILFGSFFFGQSGDDLVRGSSSHDIIFGARGRDRLNGRGGMDFMMGLQDDDTMDGGGAFDIVLGGSGNDVLDGAGGPDLVVGWHGNDRASGGPGPFDAVFGMTGDDDLFGNAGSDLVVGGRNRDVIDGGANTDFAFGGAANDTVRGGGGIDLVGGNAGSDLVEGGEGIDLVAGFAGFDFVRGNAGIDVILGMNGSDMMAGDGGTDLMFGAAGLDIGRGGDGHDLMFGQANSDCLGGDAGTDFIFGQGGADFLAGGDGVDFLLGNAMQDELRGGPGTDFLFGQDGNDNLFGEDGFDIIVAGAGQDFVDGGASADLMFGGSDNDRITGAGGFDIAFGGAGDDTITVVELAFGKAGSDDIHHQGGNAFFAWGGDANDVISVRNTSVIGAFGKANDDTIHASGTINVMLGTGGTGADFFHMPGQGGGAKSLLFGNGGNDRAQASLGNVYVFGGAGEDELSVDHDSGSDNNDNARDWVFAGRGADTLFGDSSSRKDRLFGGFGSDTKNRDAGLGGFTQPGLPTLQPNPAPGGDRSCRLIGQRPAPGAGR